MHEGEFESHTRVGGGMVAFNIIAGQQINTSDEANSSIKRPHHLDDLSPAIIRGYREKVRNCIRETEIGASNEKKICSDM